MFALIVMLVVGALAASGGDKGKPTVVAALGTATTVQGQDVIVEVIVVVPPGANASEAARQALERQGAKPFDSAGLGSAGFTVTGLVWDALPVVQNYNPSGEPLAAQTALTNTHATWDGVATSNFDIDFGSTTTRCPSLVKECDGPQVFDDFNDVGWKRLGPRTLGVTWFSTSRDEADMALNTRFNWNTDGSRYDIETVFNHENGHVVGLGHSKITGAVMEATYAGVRRNLHDDDKEGVTFLYDANVTGVVSGTVTDGTNPVAGATVSLGGTSLSATTAADGTYSIAGVPDPVTYDVTASAGGFTSSTSRQSVDGVTTADFTLTPTGGDDDGGNGACSPPKKEKGKCLRK